MTNEQIIEQIKSGYSVTDNMQMLYEKNLPLIKKIIKPYSVYDDKEDLLQESYFGLVEAVKHYETSRNVLFTTYLCFWIRQSVSRYLEQNGSVIRIPNYTKQKISRYRKCVADLTQELEREPTDEEIAKRLDVTVTVVQEIKRYMQSVISLDAPLTANDDFTLQDNIPANIDIEADAVEKIYKQYAKSKLWDIVEQYTNDRENDVIKDIFIDEKSLAAVATKQGLSANRIRQIRESGLKKLRMGKARRMLLENFEIVEAKAYRNSVGQFKQHGCSSVEYIALRKAEIEAEYEKRIRQIKAMAVS